MKVTEVLEFNPRTSLPKGKELPFIEMGVLPTSGRDIQPHQSRVVSGSGSKFRNGDTLLARITPCLENGKGGMVRNLPGEGLAHGSTEFIVMRAFREEDENFVYYISRLPEFRALAIKQMTGTSGRQRVGWQSLTKFQITQLDTDERERIGSALSLLDDKIELNPADERDAGGHGADNLQGLVRRFRPHPSKSRRPRPLPRRRALGPVSRLPRRGG